MMNTADGQLDFIDMDYLWRRKLPGGLEPLLANLLTKLKY